MKYPRTFHFPFSPEIHSDDKTISNEFLRNFINKEIIITEKLDGGNTCINKEGVFARSHSEFASHLSFAPIKALWADILPKLESSWDLYGENLCAIHSIEYEALPSYFFLFGILNDKKDFLSWNKLEETAKYLKLPLVPVVFRGQVKSIKDLEFLLESEIKKESFFEKEREGFVVRTADGFEVGDMDKFVAKYVRKGHVQTDEHWSKNWKQAKIKRAP